MMTEGFDHILEHERRARLQGRLYLGAMMIAIAVVVAALVFTI